MSRYVAKICYGVLFTPAVERALQKKLRKKGYLESLEWPIGCDVEFESPQSLLDYLDAHSPWFSDDPQDALIPRGEQLEGFREIYTGESIRSSRKEGWLTFELAMSNRFKDIDSKNQVGKSFEGYVFGFYLNGAGSEGDDWRENKGVQTIDTSKLDQYNAFFHELDPSLTPELLMIFRGFW